MRKKSLDRPTIHDVAAAAGVSTMTVSNVLLGRTGRVSAPTKTLIEKEIVRLNYRPHSTARSLRSAAWNSIGMVIVDDDSPSFLASRFVSNLVAGLSNHMTSQNYALLLQGSRADHLSQTMVLRDIRTDGICTYLSGNDAARRAQVESLIRLGQPIVLLQENMKFPGADLCTVRVDDKAGGRMLAQAVIGAGAKKLVYLAALQMPPSIAQRVAGIRDVVKKHAPTSLRTIQAASVRFEDLQTTLAADLDEHGVPDVVFGMNDDIAIAALNLLKARGLKVPQDVMVAGFNALESWRYSDPVLTTIRAPAYEAGLRGGEEILQRLRTGSFRESEIVLPVELIRGGST